MSTRRFEKGKEWAEFHSKESNFKTYEYRSSHLPWWNPAPAMDIDKDINLHILGGYKEVVMKHDPNDLTITPISGQCCNKGYGGPNPVYSNGAWHDSDCKTLAPNNEYEFELDYKDEQPKATQKSKCECGADAVYGPGNVMHSATMPCPLYRKA